MLKKKKNILKRELNGVAGTLGNIEKGNYLIFPFSEASVEKRFENFAKSLDSIIPHYGMSIVHRNRYFNILLQSYHNIMQFA